MDSCLLREGVCGGMKNSEEETKKKEKKLENERTTLKQVGWGELVVRSAACGGVVGDGKDCAYLSVGEAVAHDLNLC